MRIDCDNCEHAWIKHSTRWESEDSGCDLEHEMTRLRCEDLRSWRANPYVMLNMDAPRTQRMTNLKRWCIPQIFWTCEFMDYAREYRSVESIK